MELSQIRNVWVCCFLFFFLAELQLRKWNEYTVILPGGDPLKHSTMSSEKPLAGHRAGNHGAHEGKDKEEGSRKDR